VTPVRNQVPLPVYKAAMHNELIPEAEKPISEEALRDQVKRGFYLATIAHCMECHSRRPDGSRAGAPLKVLTARLSSAISHRTRRRVSAPGPTLRSSVRKGVGRDGRAFKLPMARQVYFSKM